MTFLTCNNTYLSLSSSLAWSLFMFLLCVVVPALVSWRRVADSPSGLKAGGIGVNSALLWFFFFPAFAWLRLLIIFLLLTLLVLLFLRWQRVFDGINKKSFICTSKRTFQPVKIFKSDQKRGKNISKQVWDFNFSDFKTGLWFWLSLHAT